jgi:hypothetical protein
MANIIRGVLTAVNNEVILPCANMTKVGINLSGTWAGTVKFAKSFDGVNFSQAPAGGTFPVFPFAPGAQVGTAVTQATANGNWEGEVLNLQAIKVTFATATSGSVQVTAATSIDASYQDAFLASSSISVSQNVAGGATNVITQAAQANRAWRLRTLSVAFSVASGASVDIKVQDGGSTTLWEGYVPANPNAGYNGGGTWLAPLPTDENIPGTVGGGVVGTPGNSLVVTLAAPGGAVVSIVNCEFAPG